MKWLPNSIRWRIQLWHGLLLLAVLTGFGFTAYHFQQANELRHVDAELRMKLYILHDQLTRSGEGEQATRGDAFPQENDLASDLLGLPPVPPDRGPQLMRRTEVARAFAHEGSTFYYTIWFRDGGVLDRSPNAPSFNDMPSYDANTHFRSTGSSFEIYEFTPPGECILAGVSSAPVQASMNRFAWSLAGYGGIVLALGLLGGWWMASRAIAPIKAISSAAGRIASGQLNERIATSETESELGQLSTVLNDTFTRLAASIEEQKRFTSDAAHELRTPLSVILAQTQLALTRQRESSTDQKTIEMTRRSAERMHSLIESLLTLAKADAGAAVQSEAVQLDTLSRENLDLIRPLAEQKGIRLHEDLAPAACHAHGEHIHQIVTNLLANAVKYSRPGDEVRLTTGRENGHVLVRIADTGPGIEAEHLPHLFERFYRADASRNRSTGGAGLGLAICKTLAEAHGGRIEVSSEQGHGSTFTLKLPASTV